MFFLPVQVQVSLPAVFHSSDPLNSSGISTSDTPISAVVSMGTASQINQSVVQRYSVDMVNSFRDFLCMYEPSQSMSKHSSSVPTYVQIPSFPYRPRRVPDSRCTSINLPRESPANWVVGNVASYGAVYAFGYHVTPCYSMCANLKIGRSVSMSDFSEAILADIQYKLRS